MRLKINFARSFNRITSSSCRAAIFVFRFYRNCGSLCAIPPHRRGTYASSRYVECGERWPRGVAALCQRVRTNDRRADGQAVWSWRPDAGVKFAMMCSHRADDGGKRARSPGRARSKPSNHRAGRAGLSRLNLWDDRVLSCTQPRVRPAPGLPCALSFSRAGLSHHSGAICAARP